MLEPAEKDLAVSRRQPFVLEIGIPGLDLTGKTFTFEARENEDSAAAWLQLATANAAAANGISSALLVVDDAPYTLVTIKASKATIEAMPRPAARGATLPGWYGFKVDGIDYLVGRFLSAPRANHA